MEILELTSFDPHDLVDMDALMHELSPRSGSNEVLLRKAVEAEDSHVYVVRHEGHIVGSACLCLAHTTEHTLGFVEAVVVSASCRGQHLGKRLMEHILDVASRLGVDSLHLTSNPKRVAANALYLSLGFERYETNVYKLSIKR